MNTSTKELLEYLNDIYLKYLWPDFVEQIEQLVIHHAVTVVEAKDFDILLGKTFTTLDKMPRFVAIPGGIRFELPTPAFEASPDSIHNKYLVQTVVEMSGIGFTIKIRIKCSLDIGTGAPTPVIDISATHGANDVGAALAQIITQIIDLNGQLEDDVGSSIAQHLLPSFSTFRFAPLSDINASDWETFAGPTKVYEPSRISIGFVADGFDAEHIHLFDALIDKIGEKLLDPEAEFALPSSAEPVPHLNEPFAQFRSVTELRMLRLIAADASSDSLERVVATFADPASGTTKMSLHNLARFAAIGLSQGGSGMVDSMGGLPVLTVILARGLPSARAKAMGNVVLVPVRNPSRHSLGELVGTDVLPAGRDVFCSYRAVDPKTNKPASSHLLVLRSATGSLRRYPIEADGSLGTVPQLLTVAAGFTHALTYTKLGKVYLLLLTQGQSNTAVFRIEPDGTIAEQVAAEQVVDSWTFAAAYTVASGTWVILGRGGSGTCVMYPVQNDGSLGPSTGNTSAGQGWQHAQAYEVDKKPRLFLLDPETQKGKVAVIDDDGTIGSELVAHSFSRPISDIQFYTIDQHTYAALLSQSDTNSLVELRFVEPDGRLGWSVDFVDWGQPWTGLTTYQSNDQSYLAAYASSSGQLRRHQLLNEDDQLIATLLHELGHTPLGRLGDEYTDTTKQTVKYLGPEPVQANLSKVASSKVKWSKWVGATPLRPWDHPITTPVEGGLAFGKGIFRPAAHCMMRRTAPFCAVCREALTSTIADALHMDYVRLSLRMLAPVECKEASVLDVIGHSGEGSLPAGKALKDELTTFAAQILACPLPEPWDVSYRLIKGGVSDASSSVVIGPNKANDAHGFDFQAQLGDLLEVTIHSSCDSIPGVELGSFVAKIGFSNTQQYPATAPSIPPSLHQSVAPGGTVTPYYDLETGKPRIDLELGALRGAVEGFATSDPCTILTGVEIRLIHESSEQSFHFAEQRPGTPAFVKPDLITAPGAYRWAARTRTFAAASAWREPEALSPDGPHFIVEALALANQPQAPAPPIPHTFELVSQMPLKVRLSATSWDVNGDDIRLEFELADSYQDFQGVALHHSEWLASPGLGADDLSVTGAVELEPPSLDNKWRVRAVDKGGLVSEWVNGPFVVFEKNDVETGSHEFHMYRDRVWRIPFMDSRMRGPVIDRRPASLDEWEGNYGTMDAGVRVWSVPTRRGRTLVMGMRGQRVIDLVRRHDAHELRDIATLNRQAQRVAHELLGAREDPARLDELVRYLAREADARSMRDLTRRLLDRLTRGRSFDDAQLLGTVLGRELNETFVECRSAEHRTAVRLLWHDRTLVGFGYGVATPGITRVTKREAERLVHLDGRAAGRVVIEARRMRGRLVGLALSARGRRGSLSFDKLWPPPA